MPINNPVGFGNLGHYTAPARALDTDYVNNTGRPLLVTAGGSGAISQQLFAVVTVGGVARNIAGSSSGQNYYAVSVTFVVPPNGTYRVTGIGGAGTGLTSWVEIQG